MADPTLPSEPRDAEGLPLHRPATLNDVRGGERHYLLAAGCSVVVVVMVIAFWVLRVLLAG